MDDSHTSRLSAGTPLIDPDLVARACQGDRHAQDSVLRMCVGPLSRFADSLLPLHARAAVDAQDVVQDVLTNASRRLTEIACDDGGALLAYLFRSVRHRVVDAIRRSARRPQAATASLDAVPSREPSPLEAAIHAQSHRRLRAALGRLGSRDRQAVLLRLHRHSYQEIAARLGSPTANAARVTVRRAVTRLGGMLDAGSGRRPRRKSGAIVRS